MDSFWLARARWHNIGLCLGFEDGNLIAIEQNPPYTVEDHFRRLLSQWLYNTRPKPTWNTLQQALESRTVNVELVIQEG